MKISNGITSIKNFNCEKSAKKEEVKRRKRSADRRENRVVVAEARRFAQSPSEGYKIIIYFKENQFIVPKRVKLLQEL